MNEYLDFKNIFFFVINTFWAFHIFYFLGFLVERTMTIEKQKIKEEKNPEFFSPKFDNGYLIRHRPTQRHKERFIKQFTIEKNLRNFQFFFISIC